MAKISYSFVIFQRGGPDPLPPPSLYPRMNQTHLNELLMLIRTNIAKIPFSCVIVQTGGPDPLPPPPLDPCLNQTHLMELSWDH